MINADWKNRTSNYSTLPLMTKTADVARRTSRFIIGVQFFSVILYTIGVLAANAGSPEEIQPYERELILKMAFPFNISTDFIYTVVSVVQFYHLFLVGAGITIVNSLLVTLVSPNYCNNIQCRINFMKTVMLINILP